METKRRKKQLSKEELSSLLESLSPGDLQEIEDTLVEQDISREKNPLLHVVLHESQLEFLNLDKKEKFLFGGNSAGKSFVGAFIAACYLLGGDPTGQSKQSYPEPRRIRGQMEQVTKGWMGAVTTMKGVEIIKQNLLPLLPKGSVEKFTETNGYLLMKNGASLQVMSYESEATRWQSEALDFVWFDEQPPEGHYDECLARVARRDGIIYCTMTPLYTRSSWTFWRIVRNKRGSNDVGYVYAHIDDNIYLDDVMYQRFVDAYKGTPEEAARLGGRHIIMQGVIHKEFVHGRHTIAPFEITPAYLRDYEFARVYDLHPRKDSVCQWFMFRQYPRDVYQVRELLMPGGILRIKEFARQVHFITAQIMGVKFNYEYDDVRSVADEIERLNGMVEIDIIDSPDPALTNTGIKSFGSSEPVTLMIEMANNGISGIKGNRDLTSGIRRLDDHLLADSFKIFKDCEESIFSIENFRWADYKGSAREERDLKEKPIMKDADCVRNMHYLMMWLDPLDDAKETLDTGGDYSYNGSSYVTNIHSGQGFYR